MRFRNTCWSGTSPCAFSRAENCCRKKKQSNIDRLMLVLSNFLKKSRKFIFKNAYALKLSTLAVANVPQLLPRIFLAKHTECQGCSAPLLSTGPCEASSYFKKRTISIKIDSVTLATNTRNNTSIHTSIRAHECKK